jgi:outer membrane protein assembly factor BamB
MKFFQQLLVAPAALGLLAPVAVTAAEVNLDGVNQYATEEQVTSISQFSDVRPTDWAYQALSNLIERYGCVAGYPDGTYRGQKAMTRFEAAALLNACLDRVTEVTDELKRLMAEFEKELAVLKGRVDGLEAKVGELEANQFSTTTKLSGIATMTLGGAGNTGFGDKLTSNYDVRLIFDTSLTGDDLLRTTPRSGNFADSVFGQGNTAMEVAFQEDSTDANGVDTVGINRLFYQFPVADGFTVTAGAKVRQDDMLAIWPSAYPADSILDLFTSAGARATYNLNLGAGFGVMYKKDGFSASANYVSNESRAEDATLGMGKGFTITGQLGYAAENWGGAFAYTYSSGLLTAGFESESVLVDDGKVIGTPCSKDAAIVALDAKTGEVIWKTSVKNPGGAGGYASPVKAELNGVPMYITLLGNAGGVVAVHAKSGKLLWQYTKMMNGTANIPSPVVKGDLVFASTGYGAGAALLKMKADGENVTVEELKFYKGNQLQNHHGGMTLVGDYVYLGNQHNQGFPACVELKTGEIKWKENNAPRGCEKSAAIAAADGMIYFRYENGVIALVEANPEEFKLVSTFKIPEPSNKPSWPHLAIASGKLYVRDQDKLHCFNLKDRSN